MDLMDVTAEFRLLDVPADVVTWYQTGIWKPQQKLSQYLYLYVAPSAAAGFGLFTSKPFQAGATVLSVTDPDYLARAMSHAEITAAGFSHADIFQVGPTCSSRPMAVPTISPTIAANRIAG